MKKKMMLICAFVLTFLMIIPTFSFASEMPIDYYSLFSQAKTSDGSESELLSVYLGNAFKKDSQIFINEASKITNDDDLNKLCELLVSYFTYENYSEFKSIIAEFENNNNISLNNKRVVDSINNAICRLDTNNTINTDTNPYVTPKVNAFDPDTILSFIIGSLKLNPELDNNIDELFNEYVAEEFILDPHLFVTTISSIADSDITIISKCIANDCKKKNISSSDIIQETLNLSSQYTRENDILNMILTEIDTPISNGIDQLADEVNMNDFDESMQQLSDNLDSISTTSTQVPTIGTMTYTSSPLVVGETETLRAVFQENKGKNSSRTYYAEVYIVKGGTSTKAVSKTFSIPSGSSSANIDFTFKFKTAGSYNTLIKVYSSSGGKLLVQRQGNNPDYVYGPPTIGVMNYTTAPLKVNDDEKLSVVFSENTSQVKREYLVKVYGVINGTKYLRSTKKITIPSGSTSTTQTFTYKLPIAGIMYTMVSVYNNTGSLLLSERTGSNPDTVTGDWKITVSLPSNRNNKGTLTLYNCRGNSVSSFECLGRSVSNDAMTVTNGNTPTGTYTGYLDGPSSPSSSYGPYKVVNMTGISGIIKTSGRSGIWIHGGDPETDKTKSWHPLRPTHGCVRISNTNQNTLQNKIENLINNSFHNKIGNIAIS